MLRRLLTGVVLLAALTVGVLLAALTVGDTQAQFDEVPGVPLRVTESASYPEFSYSVRPERVPDGWWNNPSGGMEAQHGAGCQGPPATHHITSYEDSVYICNAHVMTAIDGGGGQATLVLTPNKLLDWTNGPATFSFEMSTSIMADRDWVDFIVVPFEWQHGGWIEVDAMPKVGIQVDNGNGLSHAWNLLYMQDHVQSCLDCDFFPNIKTPILPGTNQAAARQPFRFTVSRTHMKMEMLPSSSNTCPTNCVFFDRDVPDTLTTLGMTKGIVQVGQHSYNPTKQGGEAGTVAQGQPATWHWDEFKFVCNPAPCQTINFIRGNKRQTPSVPSGPVLDDTISFAAPAPAGSYLRFNAPGRIVRLSFDNGATWQDARQTDSPANTNQGFFCTFMLSYFHPVPAGTQSVRIHEESCFGFDAIARDFEIWSLNARGAATPTTSVPPTATATGVLPTATAGPATATPSPATPTTIPPTSTSVPPTATPVLPTVTPQPGNCGLANAAFCSSNLADFVVSRVGGWTGNSLLFPHNSACGLATDVAVCDGGIRLATQAEFYSILSLRPKAAFDFAGRTGKIAFDADFESSGPLGSWLSVAVTDDPNPGAGAEGDVAGSKPRDGFVLNFNQNGACNSNGAGVEIFTYANYVQTAQGNTAFGQCQPDGVVHLELRVSQTALEVWSNGALYFSRPLSLNFTRGYVHFQVGQRAPSKYGLPYANHYVRNLGFDGPVLSETVYEVPDGGNAGIGNTLPAQATVNASGGNGRLAFTLQMVQPVAGAVVKYSLNGGPAQAVTETNIPLAMTCIAWTGGDCNWAAAFVTNVSGLVAGQNVINIWQEGGSSTPSILANVSLTSTGGTPPTPTPTPVPPTPTPVPPTATASPSPSSTPPGTSTVVPTSTATMTLPTFTPTLTPVAPTPTSTPSLGTCEVWKRLPNGSYGPAPETGIYEAWFKYPNGTYGNTPEQAKDFSPFSSTQANCRLP